MNRVRKLFTAYRSLSLCCVFYRHDAGANAIAFATTPQRQTPTPENPFAPEKAEPLPAGMTGSDVNDPRAKLTPGFYDAGEAAMGIKHVLLVKKPDAFQLGSDDPDDPKVQKTLGYSASPTHAKLAKVSTIAYRATRVCKL